MRFEEGRDAFLDDKFPEDNPYVIGTPEAQEWEDGWRDAYDEWVAARVPQKDPFLENFSGGIVAVMLILAALVIVKTLYNWW